MIEGPDLNLAQCVELTGGNHAGLDGAVFDMGLRPPGFLTSRPRRVNQP
jgi:hypothetical protein